MGTDLYFYIEHNGGIVGTEKDWRKGHGYPDNYLFFAWLSNVRNSDGYVKRNSVAWSSQRQDTIPDDVGSEIVVKKYHSMDYYAWSWATTQELILDNYQSAWISECELRKQLELSLTHPRRVSDTIFNMPDIYMAWKLFGVVDLFRESDDDFERMIRAAGNLDHVYILKNHMDDLVCFMLTVYYGRLDAYLRRTSNWFEMLNTYPLDARFIFYYDS